MFSRKVNLRVKGSHLECHDKDDDQFSHSFSMSKAKSYLSWSLHWNLWHSCPRSSLFPWVWAGNSIIIVVATKDFPSLSNYPTPAIGLESNTGSNMINAFLLRSSRLLSIRNTLKSIPCKAVNWFFLDFIFSSVCHGFFTWFHWRLFDFGFIFLLF